MGDTLICFVCNKSDGKIILFSEETLKKCQTVLKIRKKNNLKYKDIILPDEYTENGYHRECYKAFTGLMKKYLVSEPEKPTKKSEKQKSASAPTNSSSTTSSLIPKLTTEPSHLQSSSTESSITLQSSLISESIGPQATTSQENIEICEPDVSENNDSTQDANILTEKEANNINYENVCVFCDRKNKKKNSKMLPLHKTDTNQFKSSVLPNIEGQEEFTELLNKLTKISGPKISYHTECRVSFNNKLSSSKKPSSKSDWHFHREYHQLAFNEISGIIEEDVIKKGRCYLLVYLHEVYTDELEKIFKENSIEMNSVFTAHHLEEKILKKFSKDIKFFTIRNKKIIAPNYLQAIDDTIIENLQTENTLQKAALILRKLILQIEKNKLPTKNLTTEHLMSGEVSIPPQLLDFYYTLLGGCNEKRKKSLKCARQVLSYSQDVIFAVHNGHVKTPKHIMLGITLKSLTSSRKIIDIVNRYGHCISYQGIEELETETTYTSFEKSSLYPETIKRNPELFTGVAYDNFDRFVETTSGKDTLHDTVGIIYQNIEANTTEESEMPKELDESEAPITNNENNLPHTTAKKRRRRTFEAISTEEIPYAKKPKMTSELQSTIDDTEVIHSTNSQLYTEIDNIWMISHVLQLPDVLMWVGFNSRICNNATSQQRISYLTPINASPTSTSIVLETMEQSKKIAEDLHQNYIQVTYDLAIAKIALQIQSTEKPKFDKSIGSNR